MNKYLLEFKNSPFNGSLSLYKRVLLPFIVLSVIIAVISATTTLPMMAKGQGLSLSKMQSQSQERMNAILESIKNKENINDTLKNTMGEMNLGFFFIALVLALLIASWQYYLSFKLNDNEIRNGNNSFITALKSSFSSKIFTLLGANILLGLLMFFGLLIWGLIVGLFMSISGLLGGLFAFVSVFFIIALFLRFTIVPAAIVHGNMSITESFGYSWHNITLRRAFLLFLIVIVLIIIALIGTSIFMFAIYQIIPVSDNFGIVLLNQVLTGILGAFLSAFIYTSVTALYFRFSDEFNDTEDTIQEHLIN